MDTIFREFLQFFQFHSLRHRLRRAGGGVYRLRVIHGFHGGTELLRLVREELSKNPRVIRYEVGLNPGETDLVLREYY